MTGLDDIVLAEMKSLDDLENMLECSSDESIDYFISDSELDEYRNEICPRCGHKLEDCECDDDEEIYYYEEELDKEELSEIDDDPYEFTKESAPIQEVYFGKKNELREMERIIGQLRSKYSGSSYNVKINTDPLLLEFNEKMADFFGLYSYNLSITAGHIYNAYTMPVSYSITFDRNKSVADKNGFKYNKNARYSIMTVIFQGLFTSDEFTDAEIMAILLHEMGHNFSACISGSIFTMQMAMKIIAVIAMAFGAAVDLETAVTIAPNDLRNIINDIRVYIKKEMPYIYYIKGALEGIEGLLRDLAMNAYGVVDFFTFGLTKIPMAVITVISKGIANILMPVRYSDEKIADAFAGSYGYSQELQSALYKMDKHEGGIITSEVLKKIPVVGPMQDVLSLPAHIMISAIDEHPIYIERYNAAIRQLEHDLSKNNIDPKTRKIIEADLKGLKKQVDEVLKINDKYKDNMTGRKLYWTIMNNVFEGDIKHKFFDGNYFKKMDTAYEKAQKRSQLESVRMI